MAEETVVVTHSISSAIKPVTDSLIGGHGVGLLPTLMFRLKLIPIPY